MQMVLLLLFVFLVKASIFALDHRPSLFLGDSQSYLYTALTGYIPDDRSFVYGFFIRWVALWPHSLVNMVVVQTTLSALSTWLLGVVLVKYANAPFGIAAVFTFLCAIEPLELLYERFMMTETLATFLFCIYFLLCAAYVKKAKASILTLAQIVAVCLISIRISFLPLILLLSVVLPLLGPVRPWRKVASMLLLSIIISQSLLYGYRALNGSLLHRQPAYLYRDGVLLLGALSPIVKPIDFPIPSERHIIFDGLKTNMPFPIYRVVQTWSNDGLCSRVIRQLKDVEVINSVARRTAIRAALRDPLGVIKLAILTFREYMNAQQLRGWIYIDELRNHRFPPDVTKTLHDRMQFQTTQNDTNSLVMQWHADGLRWYQFILCFCLGSPLSLLIVRKELWNLTFVSIACCWCFLIGSLLPVDHTIPRYFTTAAWMVLFTLAINFEAGRNRLRAVRKAPPIKSRII